jgi:transcription elongation factor GreA
MNSILERCMANDTLPITVFGKAKLETELKRLLHVERTAIIKAIEEARAHGDISENAEYEAAKERQSLIEGRIGEIQGQLAGAEVVNPATIKSEKVVFGATVILVDLESEVEVHYQIVGVDEADVKQGKISVLSPLARALIGKTKGDTAVVRSPKSDKEYDIKEFFFR